MRAGNQVMSLRSNWHSQVLAVGASYLRTTLLSAMGEGFPLSILYLN